jgi:prepilin-type N-terminal cleavage/methylation domain-containing protein
MKRINNKGFTLVELIATIVILAIVMGIGATSIISILNKTREKDYKLLIDNVRSAVELCYQECLYGNTNLSCPDLDIRDSYYHITLGDLVKNGYLKGNNTDKGESNNIKDDKFTIVNPKDNQNISSCKIKYVYNTETKKIIIVADNPTGSCPTSY